MTRPPGRHSATEADVLIGGFFSSEAGYEALRAAMEQASGRCTVFMGLTRWSKVWFRQKPGYPRVLYRQALHIAHRLRGQGIRRVRLFGHSLGAPLALIIADAFAEELDVTEITLLCPAGIDVDGTLRTGWRFLCKVTGDARDMFVHPDQTVRRILRTSLGGVLRYAANLPRSVVEGVTLSRYRLFAALYPRLAGRGLVLRVAYGEHDSVFRSEVILAETAMLPVADVFMLEGVGHDVQFYPHKTAEALKRHGAL